MAQPTYLDTLQKFYDRGFLREVYRSKRAIVCNVYNQFYVAFDRTFLDKADEKYATMVPCFTMNSLGLKEIVKDDRFVTHYYLQLTPEQQSTNLRWIDQKLFESFERRDGELRQKPVPDHMDLDYEAKLLGL